MFFIFKIFWLLANFSKIPLALFLPSARVRLSVLSYGLARSVVIYTICWSQLPPSEMCRFDFVSSKLKNSSTASAKRVSLMSYFFVNFFYRLRRKECVIWSKNNTGTLRRNNCGEKKTEVFLCNIKWRLRRRLCTNKNKKVFEEK